jgi:hypothetical protein
MNTKILTQGHYVALVDGPTPDDQLMHGRVVNMQASLHFAGRDIEELKSAFAKAIDDYIAWCRERGVKPEEPTRVPYTIEQVLLYAQTEWSYATTLAWLSTGEVHRLTDDPQIAEELGRSRLSLVEIQRHNQRLSKRHIQQARRRFEDSITRSCPAVPAH